MLVENKEHSIHIDLGNVAPKFGIRHVQIILLSFMMSIVIGMRMLLSIAIVAMNDSSTSPNPDIPTFKWTNKSIILSSFYWGYITLQLVAGSLGRKYGTKYLLVAAMTINAVVCLLLPTAAIKFGSYGVIFCRILQGITQGCFFPSLYNLLACWSPVTERSRLGSLALAGYSFGSIIGQPVTGYMSSSWLGWPSAFYLYGIIGLVWIVLWIIFGANSPAEHRSISVAEKEYIESSLGTEEQEKPANIPWKDIFTSIPVFGLTIYHVGASFGNVALANETPIYMNKVLGFDIQWNSILSSSASVASLLWSLVCGQMADFLINKNYLSRESTRKFFCSMTCMLSSLGLAVLSVLLNDDKVWSVLMFALIGFANGAVTGGPGVNHIDLSPRYAGILIAITNSCSTIFGIVGPLVVQIIVRDETDKSQWKLFFYTTIAMYLLANAVFITFGSGKLQPWDMSGIDSSKQEDVKDKRRKSSKKLSLPTSYL